jgi:hypothetical protein
MKRPACRVLAIGIERNGIACGGGMKDGVSTVPQVIVRITDMLNRFLTCIGGKGG